MLATIKRWFAQVFKDQIPSPLLFSRHSMQLSRRFFNSSLRFIGVFMLSALDFAELLIALLPSPVSEPLFSGIHLPREFWGKEGKKMSSKKNILNVNSIVLFWWPERRFLLFYCWQCIHFIDSKVSWLRSGPLPFTLLISICSFYICMFSLFTSLLVKFWQCCYHRITILDGSPNLLYLIFLYFPSKRARYIRNCHRWNIWLWQYWQ